MDFSNRSTQPAPEATPNVSGQHLNRGKFSKSSDGVSKLLRVASVILLFSITVLMIAIAFSFYFGNNSETKYLQTGTFQAVDITGGSTNGDQIYFGNIKNINDKYLVLDNVYYIPPTTSSSNINLEPLVCQVDVPFDQMIVNRSSVNWWENLQSSGQVAKAITSYQKSNPSGPSCPKASTSSSTSSSSNSSTGTSGTTTPSTTSTTPSTTAKTPATTKP